MDYILVTGGAGYVGSHVCKALAAAGHRPVVYDDLSVGHEALVKWGPLEIGSLENVEHLEEVLRRYRPSVVMHFAASAYVGESMSNPGKYFRNNVANTVNLVEAMLAAGVTKLIASSSCSTYGVPTHIPIADGFPQNPINVYGESKLAMEKILRWYTQLRGLHCVLLRYFNAAGADPSTDTGEWHDPEPHIIPLIIDVAAGRRSSIGLFGTDYETPDGTCVRDYIHVTDLASAHVAGLARVHADGAYESYNLGAGEGRSIRELIKMVEAVSGAPVMVVEEPRRPGDPPVLVADSKAAERHLSWHPVHSDLRHIIETAWAWDDVLRHLKKVHGMVGR